MLSSALPLSQFARAIATCTSDPDTERAAVLAHLVEVDTVAAVDAGGAPVGLLRSARVLPRLRQDPSLPLRDLLEPLALVPADTSRRDLARLLGAAACAIVDARGRLLGLLDRDRLLADVLAGEDLPAVAAAEVALAPLLQVLEQLPLPLLVQDDSGRAIAQNAQWCQHICPQFGRCPLASANSSAAASAASSAAPASAQLQQWCNLASQHALPSSLPSNQSCAFCATHASGRGAWQFAKLPLATPVATAPDTAHPTRVADGGPFWLVVATDISEQHQLCRELAAKNADLVQLNRLKDEFLACISHELKSPLTAVVGLSSLLKEQTLGKLNQRQERYTGMIYQSGRQLMTLVNDMLDLTRLESGQLKLAPQTVPLAHVCEAAYQDVTSAWSEGELHVAFELDIEPGLERIVADELRLQQILVHLLSNAFKFTKAGGKVGLRVSQWEGWVAFAVWDTGVGIPAASQHLIFQKFQQLESPLTRQFEGSGLGLVLAQKLARAHGGDISFLSEVGKGSEFTLLLPPSPPPVNRPHPGSTTASHSKLVLVVEAVPRYIDTLHAQLRQLGYRVAIARSGTEALEKARTFQPRAVLLNPLLPQLSGWDVLTLLQSDARTRDIPAVVMSTRAEKDQAEACGAAGFLSLPPDGELLRRYLEGDRPAAETRTDLTILRLGREPSEQPEAVSLALDAHLSQLGYRILEADDIEQADTIARIWQPDVAVLFEANVPRADLDAIAASPYLAALPLVAVDAATVQTATELDALQVCPCLPENGTLSLETLRAAVQAAAGTTPRRENYPYVLVADARATRDYPREEWLQALTQYLETAGYRSSLSRTWEEVRSQIARHSIDLLLLDFGTPPWDEEAIAALPELSGPDAPPVLALADPAAPADEEGRALLERIATRVLPGHSQSMAELLAHVDRALEARGA